MKRITIDPITRLEGHGKIEIFLNDKGEVENTYLQVPELRGFEKFAEGRLAEDMPQITQRIVESVPKHIIWRLLKPSITFSTVSLPALPKKFANFFIVHFMLLTTLHIFIY